MPRYIDYELPSDKSDWEQIVYRYDPMEQLIISLEKLVTGYPPKFQYDHHECKGLYSGPTSVAYLFLQLSRSHPLLKINGFLPRQWAMWYLEGERSFATDTIENNGIRSELLAYHAVRAAAGGSDIQSDESVKTFWNAIKTIANSRIEDLNQWLCGRAGCLYLLRLVRHWTPPEIGQQMNRLITPMIDTILKHGSAWPVVDSAVHGRMGIITQIILCDPSKACDPKIVSNLRGVMNAQDKDYEWLLSVGDDHNEIVQFCHGAPGINISMNAIRHHFDEIEWGLREAYMMGVWWIMERGILTKEPNLCHGISGNALGCGHRERRLLMEYAANDVVEQGLRDGTFTPSEDPYGLFCGEAGRAWGWLNVLSGENDERGMIGYTDV